MAEAVLRGMLRSQLIHSSQVVASGPRSARRGQLHNLYGIKTVADNRQAAAVDILILGIKPQMFSTVLPEIKDSLLPSTLVISLAAGVTIDAIGEALGHRKIVRTMPNLPVTCFEGVTALVPHQDVLPYEYRAVEHIFESVGTTYRLEENHMDAVTALSGSGPAFVFRLSEAMLKAAEELDLPRQMLRPMLVQTLLGSAQLLAQSDRHPSDLREKICSKGGTALAGLGALETAAGNLEEAFSKTYLAAAKRAGELAKMVS